MFKLTKRHAVHALGLCVTIVVISVVLMFKTSEPAQNKTPSVTNTHKPAQPVLAHKKNRQLVSTINNDSPAEYKDNPLFEREAKARLIEISKSFSQDIKYPENSKPIRSDIELKKYIPNASVASSMASNVKEINSPHISIKSSKYQYFVGEVIRAEASIQGLSTQKTVSVSARLVQNGETLGHASVVPSGQAPGLFNVSFDDLGDQPLNTQDAIRIIAQFRVGNENYEIGTPVSYVPSVAKIDYVQGAAVHGAYLHIPVYLTTTNPGYHLVSANLYNAENGQALLHLSEQKELLIEHDYIELKGHISALKAMGHAGPYELKDISLTRMPSRPKYTTEYGLVTQESFTIEGFPFSDYEDIPYVDEQAQARLDYLAKLGGTE